MKAVVTGASGFLGGSLVRSLGRAGWQVDAYSRRGGPAVRQVADYREIAGSPDAVLFHLAEPSGVAEAHRLLAGRQGIFNVGSGGGVSIAELTRLCLQLAGQGAREVRWSAPAETSSHLVLDCTATQRETGWRPKVPLRTGLAGLITGTRHG